MLFWIVVNISFNERARYLVEYLPVSPVEDHFIVKGRNRQVVLSPNRPSSAIKA
jgi:hypothetical protein